MNSSICFITRRSCEVCGATEQEALLSRPFKSAPVWDFIERYYGGRIPQEIVGDVAYELSRCRKCSFIWQRNILNESGMETLYDRWILPEDSLQKRLHGGSPDSAYLRQAQRVKILLPGLKASAIRVLDFGMGWCSWCRAAQSLGFTVTGVDLAESRISYARQLGIESVQRLDELDGRKFHFINADQVFEHIPEPLGTLRALFEHLESGGAMSITVPNGAGVPSAVAKPNWTAGKDAVHPLEHINCFNHASLMRLGKEAGLRFALPPIDITLQFGVSSLFRSFVSGAYRTFAGTQMYFRKS